LANPAAIGIPLMADESVTGPASLIDIIRSRGCGHRER